MVRVARASSASSRIRLLLEEGAFTSPRPSAIPFLSPNQVETDSGGGGCTPVFFLQRATLSQCLPLSGPTFRVLTIGGIPLSRYSVSQRQCGLCCSQWSWRVTEGGERKGMIVRARYSVLPLLVKRPFPGEGTEGRTVVCKPPFERGSWGMFKGWKVVDFFGGHRVCGLIEKRCFEECVVCWSFSPDSTHLSFLVTSLRKYFCSSCLRSRLKRSCGICVVCFYTLNPGNGLSFPRMEWKEMGIVQGCTFFFFDSCFTFFESCIRLNVLGFVVLYLRIWKKIKFWKMKGVRYIVWIEIGSFVRSFLFFFFWDFLCFEAYWLRYPFQFDEVLKNERG